MLYFRGRDSKGEVEGGPQIAHLPLLAGFATRQATHFHVHKYLLLYLCSGGRCGGRWTGGGSGSSSISGVGGLGDGGFCFGAGL